MGVGGHAEGVLELDHPVAVQGDQVLVEGLHAVEAALGHDRGQIARPLRVGDGFGRPARVDHDLEDGHPAAVAGPADQALADDAAQGGGQRQPHLALLEGREQVDAAVDGLGGVGGVEGGEDQVAGLGGGQGVLEGLGVADLADQDDVGPWRIAARMAMVKSSLSTRTSRWLTMPSLSACRTSMGSSMVTMWTARPSCSTTGSPPPRGACLLQRPLIGSAPAGHRLSGPDG